jgi:sugar/nucleoside kinase (ribokinase family)
MVDICCIGHITSDKIVTAQTVNYQPGGAAWYFSCAMQNLPVNYLLATALAPAEMHYVEQLRDKGTAVMVQPSAHTVYFENIYGDNPDHRTQNVLHTADSFKVDDLLNIDARLFHLGPLLADDISTEIIKTLADKGTVSLDIQGYLRKVVNGKVYAADWINKATALQYVTILKADVGELKALTGYDIVPDGAKQVADWGVKELIVTNGSQGSVIYADNNMYTIPAYQPKHIIDATGCGDTYMAGYLYQRGKAESMQQCGEFAAAMAAVKMEKSGAFDGSKEDVMGVLKY